MRKPHRIFLQGFISLISNIKIYMYIYCDTFQKKSEILFTYKKFCPLINCAVYFSLFFIITVCEHGAENLSYHAQNLSYHKLGVSFPKATILKGMSLSFSPQVPLWFAHLVSSPSYKWNCLRLRQTNQESQAGKDSCLTPKKGAPDQSRLLQEGILWTFCFL